ncbi:pectate lyase [Bremerella cremea]|uniref:Pectate lyase n=1 Tax=Blastopirellula marina TaxID=124 RepID=A0A2S8F8Y2_9BACT|nr:MULTISPECIES: rhamnogalacturonan acetylesterase [Pirellulaceae]PQO28619.1 pectate lyase [Blastopirellula marina]RCS41990.1 pectate lyase [Bremerella cremea]
MKMLPPIVTLAFVLSPVFAWSDEPTSNSDEEGPVRVVIIGDSTVCEYPAERPDRGWGQFIAEAFHNGSVEVSNLAKSGRSTKTFIAEGRWKKALAKNPHYVLIQFGHNDSHDADRPESTDSRTDYQENLRRYVDDARMIGADPILVTPMVRRTFDAEGKIAETQLDMNKRLGSYAQAMRTVAKQKGVPLIDLYAASKELAEKLGPEASARMSPKKGDRTHFNKEGARAMAVLVLEPLREAAPGLEKHWKPSEN